MELQSYVLTIVSILITVSGTLTNLFSLSFFIKKNDRTPGTTILMLLNSLDLAVCLTSTLGFIAHFALPDYDLLSNILESVYYVFVEGTAFATCLLSVTRTISLRSPFYRLNVKAIFVSAGVFIGYVTVRETTRVYLDVSQSYDFIYPHWNVLGTFLIIVAVVVSNVMSVTRLLCTTDHLGAVRITENNKRATVTVLILSVLFCCFNLVHVVEKLDFYFSWKISELWAHLTSGLAIPLNSALNPAVYFCRKKEMRAYVGHVWKGITRYGVKVNSNSEELILQTMSPGSIRALQTMSPRVCSHRGNQALQTLSPMSIRFRSTKEQTQETKGQTQETKGQTQETKGQTQETITKGQTPERKAEPTQECNTRIQE